MLGARGAEAAEETSRSMTEARWRQQWHPWHGGDIFDALRPGRPRVSSRSVCPRHIPCRPSSAGTGVEVYSGGRDVEDGMASLMARAGRGASCVVARRADSVPCFLGAQAGTCPAWLAAGRLGSRAVLSRVCAWCCIASCPSCMRSWALRPAGSRIAVQVSSAVPLARERAGWSRRRRPPALGVVLVACPLARGVAAEAAVAQPMAGPAVCDAVAFGEPHGGVLRVLRMLGRRGERPHASTRVWPTWTCSVGPWRRGFSSVARHGADSGRCKAG